MKTFKSVEMPGLPPAKEITAESLRANPLLQSLIVQRLSEQEATGSEPTEIK